MIELMNEDFWEHPAKSPPAVREEAGIEVAAPANVAMGVRDTLPIVVHRWARVSQTLKAGFERLAVVSAVDVDRNELYAGFAIDRDEAPLPSKFPEAQPGEVLIDGSVAQQFVVDARAATALAWRPALYKVTVHLRDLVSNRAAVHIGQGPTAYDDDAIPAYLEAQRGRVGPPPVWPDEGRELPSYRKRDDSPAAPPGGIAFEVERVSVLRPGARCLVRGAFNLPIAKEELVPPPTTDYPAKRPHAIVGIHLLVMGSEDATPFALPVRVPVWEPLAQGPRGPVGTGYFAFDLFALVAPSPMVQTFFVYAFHRDLMIGPVPAAVVTPDMLPPGAR